MRHLVRCCSVLLFALVLARAQETLTNDAVVKMVKAGLTEDLILSLVNSQPCKFNLGVDDLLNLKQAGVPEKVISAMVKRSKPGAGPGSADRTAPGSAEAPAATAGAPAVSEVGVYFKKGDQWVEVLPEVVNWKTGGVLKTLGTAGIVKGDVNGLINGAQSHNLVRTPLEFLIYTADGVAITEYQLLRLHVKKDTREFRTVTGGVFHQSGGAIRDLVPFEWKKIAPRTYTVALSNIGPGEYGFLPPGAALSSHASAQLGKMCTFKLLE